MNEAERIVMVVALVLLAPVCLFVLGRMFPVTPKTKILFQPPSWVFGVVWSVLSLMIGVITAQMFWTQQHIAYLPLFLVTISLWCCWIIVNHLGRKDIALAILILSGLCVAGYVSYLSYFRHLVQSSLLLFGGITWLLLASAMNGVENQAYLQGIRV